MKKLTVFVLILALVAGTVFAGGGGEKASGSGGAAPTAANPVTLTFRTWNPSPGPGWDLVLAAWEKIHPEVKIEIQQVQYSDHVQSLKVVVASGEGPDLYGVQTGAIMEEFQEFTVDLAPLCVKAWGADWEKKFTPTSLALTKGNMKSYYGLPTGGGFAGYLWANLSYFTKYNLKVPQNYNELVQVCKTFRSKGELPLIIGAKDDWINIDMFMNMAMDINPAKFFDAVAGKASFTDPSIIQALTIWQKCFDDGVFQDGALGINVYNDATTIWEDDKKAPMICNGSWVSNGIDDFGVGEHYDVWTMDWNNDGKPAPVAPSVDVVVSISNESKHLDLAWTFLEWYSLEGVKNLINYNLQYLPVQVGYNPDLSKFSAEAQKDIKKVLDIGSSRAYGYRDISYPRLKQTICDQLKAVALHESTPQQAADIIEKESKATKR